MIAELTWGRDYASYIGRVARIVTNLSEGKSKCDKSFTDRMEVGCSKLDSQGKKR